MEYSLEYMVHFPDAKLEYFWVVSVTDLQIQDEDLLLIGYRNLMGIERVKVWITYEKYANLQIAIAVAQ